MKSPLLSLLATVALFHSSPATYAQVETTANATLPTGPFYVSQPIQLPSGNWGWNNVRPYVGQSFLAPDNGWLQEIVVRAPLVTGQALNKAFTLYIYESAEQASIGVIKSTQTGTLPSAIEANNYLNFRLESVVELLEGKYYTFIFNASDLPSSFLNFSTGTTSNFPGDRWSSTDGITFTRTGGTTDFEFYVNVIPEPSTAWLFGLAIPALYVMKIRRNRIA